MEAAQGVGVDGLVHHPRWLDGEQQRLLLASIDAAPWSTELRRRVQHYGHEYDYRRRAIGSTARGPATPMPDWARALASRLLEAGHTDRPFDQVIVNEYLPGQGIAAHVDLVPRFGPVIAALSLSSPCPIDFTSPDGAERRTLWLEPGSLYVMTGPARYAWRHGIAARSNDVRPDGRVARGRRVSVTFRTVLP